MKTPCSVRILFRRVRSRDPASRRRRHRRSTSCPVSRARPARCLMRIVQYEGSTNGAITVEVKNPTEQPQEFSAKGIYFVPTGNAERGAAAAGRRRPVPAAEPPTAPRSGMDHTTIAAGATARMTLDVYCIDSHRASPSSSTSFRVAKDARPEAARAGDRRGRVARRRGLRRRLRAGRQGRRAVGGVEEPRQEVDQAGRRGRAGSARRAVAEVDSLHQRAAAGLEPERDRAVVHQIDGHVGAEAAGLDGEAGGAQPVGDAQVERLGARRLGGGLEAGAVALSQRRAQRELADDQAGAARRRRRSGPSASVPGKMRSAATLRAVASASASASPFSTPTNSSRPRSMRPTRSPPTRTSARVTRWTTVFIAGDDTACGGEPPGPDRADARGCCLPRRRGAARRRRARRRARRRGGRDGRDRDDAAARLAAAARSRAGERPDGDRRRDRRAPQPGSRGLHARRARQRQRQPGPAEPAAARPAVPRLPRVAAAGRAAGDVGLHRRRPAERTVRRHAELGPDPDGGGPLREPDARVEPALRAEHAGRRAVAGDEDRLLRSRRRGSPAGRIVRPPAAGRRPGRPRRALGRVRGGAILRRGGLAAVLAVAHRERVRRGAPTRTARRRRSWRSPPRTRR